MNYLTIPDFQDMTAQQVFDMSAKHLLRQGESCVNDDGVCLYRGENGFACAAGVFLTDEGAAWADSCADTDPKGWDDLVASNQVPDTNAELVKDLQEVHDMKGSRHWRESLILLAEKYNLSGAVCHASV